MKIIDKKVNFKQAKLIETNEQKRAESCLENVNRVLLQHDCTMVPVVEIVGNRVKSKVAIVTRKR